MAIDTSASCRGKVVQAFLNKTYSISSMETEHIFPIEENDTLDTMFHKVREIAKTIYNF